MKNLSSDVREECGRTYYVSAGSSAAYKNFTWTMDSRGFLTAANGTGGSLAAHRTYINDCIGKVATYVISTIYPGHENRWRLERFGDLDR